jgi:anti-anti-sigma regulatory factor
MEPEGTKKLLKLVGEYKIDKAEALRGLLLKAYEEPGDLLLNVRQVEEVDVACLQIFCSAHRTYLKAGRVLAFDGPLAEEFKRSVEEAGFSREKGCTLNRTRTCLWARESDDE